eukprot:TRINITY_DN9221_c0_g1_i7.p1 TRINITY_DN9221_c0_g1~~TRINITY_DN9221_c0_g1_i7.p1  ORF type:complete len:269 (+),score=41.69 TRINITY_DN9221_c0_g1_i7:197-1003(+)
MEAAYDGRQIAIKQSPSLRFNNLAHGGGSLVYSHLNEIWRVAEPSAVCPDPIAEKLAYKGSPAINQVKQCAFPDGTEVLVVCTTAGLQIWNSASQLKILDHPLPAGDPESAAPSARGATAVISDQGNFVCVGTSEGVILVFKMSGSEAALECQLDGHDGVSITELTTDMLDQTKMGSADSLGKVITWSSENFEKESVFPATGEPCTSVKMKGALVLTTDAVGAIRILNREVISNAMGVMLRRPVCQWWRLEDIRGLLTLLMCIQLETW